MEKAKKQYPTDDEIARVMAERKLNRIGAVQYRRTGAPQGAESRSQVDDARLTSDGTKAKRKSRRRSSANPGPDGRYHLEDK